MGYIIIVFTAIVLSNMVSWSIVGFANILPRLSISLIFGNRISIVGQEHHHGMITFSFFLQAL